jgi:hypothetical protein
LIYQRLRGQEWLRQWLSRLRRTIGQCCSRLLCAGGGLVCSALESLLGGLCAAKLGWEQFQVLLCDGDLTVSGKNLRVLFVQLVQRRKLPLLRRLELRVLEIGDFSEDSNLLHKVLKTLRVHGKVVLIDRLRKTGLFLFL